MVNFPVEGLSGDDGTLVPLTKIFFVDVPQQRQIGWCFPSHPQITLEEIVTRGGAGARVIPLGLQAWLEGDGGDLSIGWMHQIMQSPCSGGLHTVPGWLRVTILIALNHTESHCRKNPWSFLEHLSFASIFAALNLLLHSWTAINLHLVSFRWFPTVVWFLPSAGGSAAVAVEPRACWGPGWLRRTGERGVRSTRRFPGATPRSHLFVCNWGYPQETSK